MLKVGLTGGIGSGKSIVCKAFRQLGIPVFHADEEAKRITDGDEEVKHKVTGLFGKEIYAGKKLNRVKVAEIVFHDNQKLKALNQIIHPAVARKFERWLQEQASACYVLKEAAILFESGTYKNMDYNITVYAPAALRIERVMNRDNASREEVENRMHSQWNDEKKKKLADFVIINDGQELVLPQALKIHSMLQAK